MPSSSPGPNPFGHLSHLYALPFCDWCPLRVYSLSPSVIGDRCGYAEQIVESAAKQEEWEAYERSVAEYNRQKDTSGEVRGAEGEGTAEGMDADGEGEEGEDEMEGEGEEEDATFAATGGTLDLWQ
eukprot:1179077-Prorocentrum_minimum.AAC.1